MLEDEAAEAVAQLCIELGEGLVEQQRARPRQQRAQQRDARALPARQRGRVAIAEAGQAGIGERRSMRARRCAVGRTAAGSAKARLPATDRCGNSRSSWNRMPTRRASGGSGASSVSPR